MIDQTESLSIFTSVLFLFLLQCVQIAVCECVMHFVFGFADHRGAIYGKSILRRLLGLPPRGYMRIAFVSLINHYLVKRH